MNHLMVDLETMGNGPYAPVISIGAVFFDPNIPTSLKLTRACVITAHAMALSVMTEEFTMRGLAYNPSILPAEMIIRQRVKPMPSREELLKRNSFPSVNQNKYLNAMWRSGKK